LHIDLFQFISLGLHKKSYVETSVNPGSYSGAISFQSSIHQDIILDVPNPISSSMTVISSSHGFDVPEEKFSPEDAFKEKENVDEISDLEVEVNKFLGMDTLDNEILDESTLFFSATTSTNKIYDYSTQVLLEASDALLSLPYSGSSSSCVVPSVGDSKISYASVKTAEYYQARKGSNKGFKCQLGISDPLDLRWMPSVDVDLRLFDLTLVAPQQVFHGDRFSAITHECKKVRFGVEEKQETFAPFDEIVSVVTGFEFTVWPMMKQGCYNTYVERNGDKGYMFCKTACAAMAPAMGPIPNCRFWVGFTKSSDPRTGADIGIINKCYLTHDCRSSINIEYDVVNSIKHVYRARMPKLKYLVPQSVFLSCFWKEPDLTKNNGTTAKQIRRSVENEDTCIPITKSQAFSFLSSKNHNSWDVHAKEFTELPDLFLKLQEADPEGLYIVEFLPVAYELSGYYSKSMSEELLMFNYSLCIPPLHSLGMQKLLRTWYENLCS
jgi:hypothetical protein